MPALCEQNMKLSAGRRSILAGGGYFQICFSGHRNLCASRSYEFMPDESTGTHGHANVESTIVTLDRLDVLIATALTSKRKDVTDRTGGHCMNIYMTIRSIPSCRLHRASCSASQRASSTPGAQLTFLLTQ